MIGTPVNSSTKTDVTSEEMCFKDGTGRHGKVELESKTSPVKTTLIL